MNDEMIRSAEAQKVTILILISTFGGLAMFGFSGLVIGPVIASLFVTVWDIYYETFRAPVVDEEDQVEAQEATA